MFIRVIAGAAVLSGLVACADFPDLNRAVPKSEVDGPYPPLVPVGTLLAQTDDPRIEEDDPERLDARARALQARAARLRQY